MSFIVSDRVKETSTTTGTGTLSMAGAVTGFQTFVNGIGNGNTCAYLIDDGNGNWELTYGVITSGTPATLTRGTLINSSTGSRISFAAGSKTVTVVPAAELMLWAASSAVLVETSIASATTTDLGSVTTLLAQITGTTTITGFGTQPKSLRYVRFAGALTLTHNATSLILLTGANRTTAAGDVGLYTSDASGNWREMFYSPVTSAWPSFMAYLTASTAALTGDGTLADVPFNAVDQNVGTAFATGTGLFTAPVAGEYEFATVVNFASVAAAHTEGRIDIVCSGGQIIPSPIDSPGVRRSLANQAGYSIGRFTVVLAAGETVKVRAYAANSTKVVTALGGHNPSYSWFSGRRVK